MKQLLSCIFFTFIFSFCLGQDIFYVNATNGLALKSQPDINSDRIELLQNGTSLLKIKDTGIEETIVDEGVEISSVWFKVSKLNDSNAAPTFGYVFSHFLTANFNKNTDYMVISDIGLSMRVEPNIDSKRITRLPRGTEVRILHQTKNQLVINEGEKEIKGFWTEVVVTNSEDKKLLKYKGFVFGGYLEKLDSEAKNSKYLKIDLHTGNTCSHSGEPFDKNIYSFTSSSEAIGIIDDIVSHVGLKRNFHIRAANVPNAVARTLNGRREIFYSQSFISNIVNETSSYWAAIGLLAHEVGHHLNGHTLSGIGSRPPTELEADEFAGFVMFQMGATLSEAQSVFNNSQMFQSFDSPTHPATSARLEAIAVGWQKAKDLLYTKTKAIKEVITSPQRETVKPSEVASDSKKFIFNNVQLIGNVYEGDVKGLKIKVNYSATNWKDVGGNCTAYFYFENGEPLKDYNGEYRTKNGYISSSESFRPSASVSDNNELSIFIPIDELHMNSGYYYLKAVVQVKFGVASQVVYTYQDDLNFQIQMN